MYKMPLIVDPAPTLKQVIIPHAGYPQKPIVMNDALCVLKIGSFVWLSRA